MSGYEKVAATVLVFLSTTTLSCCPALESEKSVGSLAQRIRKVNVEMIADALRRVQEEGGKRNFVVFTTGSYYIQFAARKDGSEFYVEAVSNRFLSPDNALSSEQIERLKSLGWRDSGCSSGQSGDSNYCRQDWWANNDEQRSIIAELVMRTFVGAYGVPSDALIGKDLMLE